MENPKILEQMAITALLGSIIYVTSEVLGNKLEAWFHEWDGGEGSLPLVFSQKHLSLWDLRWEDSGAVFHKIIKATAWNVNLFFLYFL